MQLIQTKADRIFVAMYKVLTSNQKNITRKFWNENHGNGVIWETKGFRAVRSANGKFRTIYNKAGGWFVEAEISRGKVVSLTTVGITKEVFAEWQGSLK